MRQRPVTFSHARKGDSQRNAHAEGIDHASAGGGESAGISDAAQTLVSRRGFLFGAVGVAAAAAIGGTAFGVTQCSKKEVVPEEGKIAVGDLSILNVPESSVFTTEDCAYIENGADFVHITAEAELPYGTMVWADDDNVAACLLPCETSSPLTQVGLLNLSDGKMHTVLSNAVGQSDGFEIYDARANSHGVVWTEADIVNGIWRIYAAPLSAGTLGAPKIVAQGDGNFTTPTIAVSKNYAFWQTIPNPNGDYAKESSLLMRAPFGGGEEDAKVVFESTGKMACAPSTAADGIVIAPRADASGTYYELTYIDADSGQVADTLVLPSQMKPTFVSYGETGFSFAFDSIYSYGGGISNLGTYTSTSSTLANDTPWFRFPRTPYTNPAWNKDWLIVKSTSVVAAVDLANRMYFTLAPDVVTQGYGEFLASSGSVAKIVTYSNVDHVPLGGEKITMCLVRIWEVDPSAVPVFASDDEGEGEGGDAEGAKDAAAEGDAGGAGDAEDAKDAAAEGDGADGDAGAEGGDGADGDAGASDTGEDGEDGEDDSVSDTGDDGIIA